jgi:membrane protein YdbS with pleckstrin-like domain
MIVGTISIASMIAMLVVGIPWWIIYPSGVIIIVAIIFKFGKVPDPADYTPDDKEPAVTSLDG